MDISHCFLPVLEHAARLGWPLCPSVVSLQVAHQADVVLLAVHGQAAGLRQLLEAGPSPCRDCEVPATATGSHAACRTQNDIRCIFWHRLVQSLSGWALQFLAGG